MQSEKSSHEVKSEILTVEYIEEHGFDYTLTHEKELITNCQSDDTRYLNDLSETDQPFSEDDYDVDYDILSEIL